MSKKYNAVSTFTQDVSASFIKGAAILTKKIAKGFKALFLKKEDAA